VPAKEQKKSGDGENKTELTSHEHKIPDLYLYLAKTIEIIGFCDATK